MNDEMDDIRQRLDDFVRNKVTDQNIEFARRDERETERWLIEPFLSDVLGWVKDKLRMRYPPSSLYTTNDKVDIALMSAKKEPLILIEVKQALLLDNDGEKRKGLKQLDKYMKNESQAKLGILTDGLVWQWHVRGQNKNKDLDERPVYRLDLRTLDKASIEWLHYVSQPHFVPDHVQVKAVIEQHRDRIQTTIHNELRDPSDDFCKQVMKKAGLQGGRPYQKDLIAALRAMIQKQAGVATTRPSPSCPEPAAAVPGAAPAGSSIRWKIGDGWSVHEKAIDLYVDVLRWLARQHDDGMHDWAKDVIKRYSGSFSRKQEGRFRTRIDLDGQDMYCSDKGNKEKLQLLAAIAGMTIRNGQPLVMDKDKDLQVEMDSQQRSTPES